MMKLKNISTIVLIFISGIGIKTMAQEVEPLKLDLNTCRIMALESSKNVQMAKQEQLKAEGNRIAAKSAWFPNISASATGIYNENEFKTELILPTKVFDPMTGQLVENVALNPMTGQPIIGPDGNPVFNTYAFMPIDISVYGGAMASISAEQPIYAGGKIIAANKMAKIGTSMAENNNAMVENQMVYETDCAYYMYLSVNEKVALAEKYNALLGELVHVLTDSYETGMVNKNELLKVQVQLNEATLQLQKANTGLELSRMSLCRFLGVDFSTPLEINDSLNVAAGLKGDEVFLDASARIEYQLLKQQVELAEQNIKMVRSDYLPEAGVSAGYSYFNIGLKNMDNYDSHGLNVMGNISIPITTFGERKGKMQVAKAELNQKQLELENTAQLLQLEMEQAKLNYKDAFTRVELSNESLKQADENLRINKDHYDLGMETVVNLLEAQAEWQKAYSNKIDAITDFKIQESNYLRVLNNYELK